MTFTGSEGTDLSGSNGAGNDQAGIRADLKALFNLLSTIAKAGKIPVYDDDGNLPVASGIGIGEIAFFPSSTAPTNYLKANGALLSRTQYASLWSFAQNSGNVVADSDWSSVSMYGSFSYGDGSTTFRIPKLNGYFVRSWDDSAGVDSSRVLGKYQADEIKSHTHQIRGSGGGEWTDNYTPSNGAASADYTLGWFDGGINNTGDTETRPKNIALLACIRYE